jgi:hypothetical protein
MVLLVFSLKKGFSFQDEYLHILLIMELLKTVELRWRLAVWDYGVKF